MTDDSYDDWTPEERARLAEVGRHRSPRSELRARTIGTLREHGLLGAGAQPRPRRQLFFALAAAMLVFAVGVVAGYTVGLRHQPGIPRDSVAKEGRGIAHEVARLDSPSTLSPTTTGRHVIWF